jgi:hypothetical protein
VQKRISDGSVSVLVRPLARAAPHAGVLRHTWCIRCMSLAGGPSTHPPVASSIKSVHLRPARRRKRRAAAEDGENAARRSWTNRVATRVATNFGVKVKGNHRAKKESNPDA